MIPGNSMFMIATRLRTCQEHKQQQIKPTHYLSNKLKLYSQISTPQF